MYNQLESLKFLSLSNIAGCPSCVFFLFYYLFLQLEPLLSLFVSHFFFSFSFLLIYSALGMYEHLYYKAILNNRSFAPSDRRTRLQGNSHIHKYMHPKSQRRWGTLLEGSNLLVLSPSSAVSVLAFTGLHLKDTDNTPNRESKIYITPQSVIFSQVWDICVPLSYVEKQPREQHQWKARITHTVSTAYCLSIFSSIYGHPMKS